MEYELNEDTTPAFVSQDFLNQAPVVEPVPLDQGRDDAIRHKAEKYRQSGLVPIPIGPRGKTPIRKAWQQSTLQTSLDDFVEGCNVAILLGDPSGGLLDIDLDCPEAVVVALHFLPETGMVFGPASDPHSHWVYRVKDCGGTKSFKADGEMIVEYRANGANTTFPPSVYESGEPRKFSSDGEPAEVSRDELIRCVGKVAAASFLAQHWVEGTRHQASLAIAGMLLRAGWHLGEVEEFVRAICDAADDEEVRDRIENVQTTEKRLGREQNATGFPTLADLIGSDDADRIAEWLGLKSDMPGIGHNGPPVEELRCSDMGNADRLVAQHGEDVGYCKELGWLVWDSTKWEPDTKGRIVQKAEHTVRSIAEELFGGSRHVEDELRRWMKRSGSKERLFSMITLVQSRLPIDVEKLDQNGWLLNCTNGTLDLKAGCLLPHNREHLITKIAPVRFDPHATCPRFETFLNEIMNGDKDVIGYLQKWFGYCLTGDTREQCMFIFYGTGANGKSTLTNLFEYLMGDYASNTPVNTLLSKKNDGGIPNDIARLRGARLVTASEVGEGQSLAVPLLKRLTGEDTITARFLQKEYFQFVPVLKLILPTNHKPKIDGTDEAMTRRIHLVPFNVVIPKEKQDGDLSHKLKSEASGILNWALAGCLEWQSKGLVPPDSVKTATDSYKAEMDEIGRFVEECVFKSANGSVTIGDMFNAFETWARENGCDAGNKKALTTRLKAYGLVQTKSGSKRMWKGCQLEPGSLPDQSSW